jgi:hypothetical protein
MLKEPSSAVYAEIPETLKDSTFTPDRGSPEVFFTFPEILHPKEGAFRVRPSIATPQAMLRQLNFSIEAPF